MKKGVVYLVWAFVIASISFNIARAQRSDTLKNVKVFAIKKTDLFAVPVQIQQLNKTQLQQINSISVADAARFFSGVVLKDYGGIGGLKTNSVRSLGANHTGVLYDGMMMGDAQGGQIDLGTISLDQLEQISLLSKGNPSAAGENARADTAPV